MYHVRVIRQSCETFGADARDVLAYNRRPTVCDARHVAMAVLYVRFGWTLKRIGRTFGRDHSTVHHAICKVRNLCDVDPEFLSKTMAVLRAS